MLSLPGLMADDVLLFMADPNPAFLIGIAGLGITTLSTSSAQTKKKNCQN